MSAIVIHEIRQGIQFDSPFNAHPCLLREPRDKLETRMNFVRNLIASYFKSNPDVPKNQITEYYYLKTYRTFNQALFKPIILDILSFWPFFRPTLSIGWVFCMSYREYGMMNDALYL